MEPVHINFTLIRRHLLIFCLACCSLSVFERTVSFSFIICFLLYGPYDSWSLLRLIVWNRSFHSSFSCDLLLPFENHLLEYCLFRVLLKNHFFLDVERKSFPLLEGCDLDLSCIFCKVAISSGIRPENFFIMESMFSI